MQPDHEINNDQSPAKKQKLSSKEDECIIMGNKLSDHLYINMAQNLLKAQFPRYMDLSQQCCKEATNIHRR